MLVSGLPSPPGVEIPISVWSIVCITGVSGVTIFYWLDKLSRWLISALATHHSWHLHSLPGCLPSTPQTSNIRPATARPLQLENIKTKTPLDQTILRLTCFWSLISPMCCRIILTGADLVLFSSVPADDKKILLKITDSRLLMNLWAFVWRLRQNFVWLVFFCKLLMTWPRFISLTTVSLTASHWISEQTIKSKMLLHFLSS